MVLMSQNLSIIVNADARLEEWFLVGGFHQLFKMSVPWDSSYAIPNKKKPLKILIFICQVQHFKEEIIN